MCGLGGRVGVPHNPVPNWLYCHGPRTTKPIWWPLIPRTILSGNGSMNGDGVGDVSGRR